MVTNDSLTCYYVNCYYINLNNKGKQWVLFYTVLFIVDKKYSKSASLTTHYKA